MAEINFPDNPTDGLVFSTDSKSWRWSQAGTAWVSIGADATGITGNVGNSIELVNGAIALDDDISINRIQIRDWSYLNLPPNIKLGTINYNFPTSNGLAKQVLASDGNENLTWQDNTVITNLANTYSTSEAAEAEMSENGFYTWTSSDRDNYRSFAFKESNKVWHLREYINSTRTFTVGSDPNDDFATPYDANEYLAHCDLGSGGISVYVRIRPGVYQIPFPLRGHPQGDRIYYLPIDAAAEPVEYPDLEDFSTIASPSSANDLAMLRSKYPVQIEMVGNYNGIHSMGQMFILRDCLIINTNETSNKYGGRVEAGGYAQFDGCAFFGWNYGVVVDKGSDARIVDCTAAWCSNDGFFCGRSSDIRAGSSGRIMAAHCSQALVITEGSNGSIDNVYALGMGRRAVEVKHNSNLSQNGTVNYTISGCNLRNGEAGYTNTTGALHVRRNSTLKISSAIITGHKSHAINCDSLSYIYMPATPDIHDKDNSNLLPDILIQSKSHIDVGVADPADFVSNFEISFGTSTNIIVPGNSSINNGHRQADEGVYGSILIY